MAKFFPSILHPNRTENSRSFDSTVNAIFPKHEVVIVSYDLARKHCEYFQSVVWDHLVLDEGEFCDHFDA